MKLPFAIIPVAISLGLSLHDHAMLFPKGWYTATGQRISESEAQECMDEIEPICAFNLDDQGIIIGTLDSGVL